MTILQNVLHVAKHVIGTDRMNDLAAIKVQPGGVRPLPPPASCCVCAVFRRQAVGGESQGWMGLTGVPHWVWLSGNGSIRPVTHLAQVQVVHLQSGDQVLVGWGGRAEADRLASLFLAWVFFSLGLRMKGNEGHWNRRHARVGHNIPKPNMYVFSFSVQNEYGGVQNMFIFSLCCLPRLLLVFRDSDKMYICPNLCPGVISFPLSAESFKK